MSWEHDAQQYGRQLLHAASMRYSIFLPSLSGEDTAKCTVLEAAGGGNCSLHSIYRLLHPERDTVVGATPEEIRETRQETIDEMTAVAFTENYGQLLDNKVSEEEMLRLSNLDVDKEDIHNQLGYDFLAVCQLALAAEVKEWNIVVLEAKAGAGLRIVEVGKTTGCFIGNLFGKDFLHLVYNDCGGYSADSYAEGAVTVRNPSSSNVAETKLNHFSAIAADDYCPCPTTSDKRSTNYRGSTIALDTGDDDVTETNSSVRSLRSAEGARSVTTSPTGVSKPDAPPRKAAIKPATPPSSSSMSATTGANETPTPAVTPTKLASSKAHELSVEKKHGKRKRRETCHDLFAGGKRQGQRCGAEAKSRCGMLCSMHSKMGGQNRTCGTGGNGSDDDMEYVQEPEGDEEMNHDEPSVTIESPQQINAMLDMIPEGLGKATLKLVFELVHHTHDFRNDRKHESYRGTTSFGEIESLVYTEY
ncbi:unnamed protein product [Ectocarpus sp. CCAP 1310/34]|nr:unnamed protein product [Ectocarpus sp. CCAP 1310/34]